jgi:phosphatidylinositol alpha 1,6-mannosyltransferase
MSEKNMKKLRIALFTANYNHIPDGVSLTLNRLVGYLLAQGHEVQIFAPTIDNPPIKQFGNIHKIPAFSIPGRDEYLFAVGFNRRAQEALRQFNPDLVHIATPDLMGLQALLYCKERRIPVVGSYHTHFSSYFAYYKIGMLEALSWKYLRGFYNACEHTYVPSLSMIEELQKHGFTKNLRIWARGIETDKFNPEQRSMTWRRSLGVGDDQKLIGFVSRLVTEKEMSTLRNVFSVLNTHPNIKTIIVGEGPERAAMQQALPETIFTGHLKGDDLYRAYASLDVFMFPSLSETFGNVTLEALASGVPAVVANAQGNRSLVEDGYNGFLVAPRSTKEFVDQIVSLASDDELRRKFAVNALSFGSSFTWDRIFGGLIQHYYEVLADFDRS